MTEETIEESGMVFGPFAAGNLYRLEVSAVYQRIEEGVPMAEFVAIRVGSVARLFSVEAKTSSPRADNYPDFPTYIEAVSRKLMNGFHLLHAVVLERHGVGKCDLPAGFSGVDFGKCEHRLLLVIKNAQRDWLPPIQDALRLALRAHVKLWGLSPNAVAVLNEEMARKNGLIQ